MKPYIYKVLISILALTLVFTFIGVLKTTQASTSSIVLKEGLYYLYSPQLYSQTGCRYYLSGENGYAAAIVP